LAGPTQINKGNIKMSKPTFEIVEATIDNIQDAFKAGTLSAKELTQAYINRIEAIDRSGPKLNSVISVNPKALSAAEELDKEYARTGKFRGPLHGIPIVVKDQVETKDVMTTFGSIAQDGYMPADDATTIKKLKAAGAIILAKTAMPDFATSWFGFCSKIGETKNPYVLDRDPGGSSGGTAAAIAASLAVVGIGEDTGGSIRLPASFTNLVGVRVTPGLISRNGTSPLVVFQDTTGPMARTVKDAALLLDSMVGYDPTDEYTVAALIADRKGSYADAMDTDSIKGARIGVVRNALGPGSNPDSAPVNKVVEQAIAKLKAAGATIVDIEIPDLMDHIIATSLYGAHSRHDINEFLASRPNMPTKSLEEVKAKKLFDPTLDLLIDIFEGPQNPEEDPQYFQKLAARDRFQRLVVGLIGKNNLNAITFPCVQVVPPTKKDVRDGKHKCLTYPTNTLIAAQTWLPSICMPAGFTDANIPVGMEIVVLPYHEPDLFRLGAGFENTIKARRAPQYLL
jgi:Asp-tRNA(Asn)/Glu-tRNA(Gln) amidotransferase A subunit family amidase